jgi:hypothetical protein
MARPGMGSGSGHWELPKMNSREPVEERLQEADSIPLDLDGNERTGMDVGRGLSVAPSSSGAGRKGAPAGKQSQLEVHPSAASGTTRRRRKADCQSHGRGRIRVSPPASSAGPKRPEHCPDHRDYKLGGTRSGSGRNRGERGATAKTANKRAKNCLQFQDMTR